MQTHIEPISGHFLRKLLLTALAFGGPVLFAQRTDDETRPPAAQILALEARLEAFEHSPKPVSGVADPRSHDTPIIAADATGFLLTSADKRYQLRIRGNIHADARFYLGDASGRDDFLLRRVRPSFEGIVAEKFKFRIMPDLAGSSFTLLDAYVTYSASPAFNVLIGKAKAPFDLERLVSQTDLLFIERAYPTSLGPNRDVGIQVFGDVPNRRLAYQLAVGNGARDNDSSVSDFNNDKDLVARLWAHPFRGSGGPLEGLGIGFAITHGERSGALNGYRTSSLDPFFNWRSEVTAAGDNTRLSPQFYYYKGPFGLIGSWVASRHEVALESNRETLTQKAWYLAAHWVLTGEDAGYRGVKSRQDFSPTTGTWGAWELAMRYSELAIDGAAFPVFADAATSASKVVSYTFGVNGYLNRNVKIAFNYEHTDFTTGPFGTVQRRDGNALLARIQVSF